MPPYPFSKGEFTFCCDYTISAQFQVERMGGKRKWNTLTMIIMIMIDDEEGRKEKKKSPRMQESTAQKMTGNSEDRKEKEEKMGWLLNDMVESTF